jgi:hypothetical protein
MTSHGHLEDFRAWLQARHDPPQRDMPEDHFPDPDDSADFELPDQQALIDAFTAGLCKESQHDLSPCLIRVSVMDMSRLKMKLCRGAAAHLAGPRRPGRSVRGTAARPVGRPKRVTAAIAKGHFTSHSMRESNLDGDQDLTLWLRSLEDVLREVLGDDIHTYDRQTDRQIALLKTQ